MFFKKEENYEHEYMSMKEVMEATGFSRSHCYWLKDKNILHAIQEGTEKRPTYKYLTRSVLEIMAKRDEYLRQRSKLEVDGRRERERKLTNLRKRYYAR